MTSAPPRIHIISRTLVAVTAAVFISVGFASSALAVTLSEGRRVSTGVDPIAVANERGVLITSRFPGPSDQIFLDFVPVTGATTRHIVTPSSAAFLSSGSNGREFLIFYVGYVPYYDETPHPAYGILLDSAGIPTRTVTLPPVPNWPFYPVVVLATNEGFDIYIAHDKRLLRVSVHLDGTTSGTWQTAATLEKEIGFFDVLNLAGGEILIYLIEADQCRLCTSCGTPYNPVYAAVTSRDGVVNPVDFSVPLEASGWPDAEVGSDGRMWFLSWPQQEDRGHLTEVRELVAGPRAPVFQSRLLVSDTDGPGRDFFFRYLTRFGGGFVVTELGPGGDKASLRTSDGYEWDRLPISSTGQVLAVLPGPGERVSFILYDYFLRVTEVRFLSLGRTRGVSPVKRVRPARPE